MSDYISREVAIDAVRQEADKVYKECAIIITADDACEVIARIPSAGFLENAQNEWIPCSERLPELETIVLISQSYSWQNHEEGATVTLGRLHCAKDRGGYTYWEWQHYRPDFKHGTIMDNGIICPGGEYVDAWMPLPESYR